MKKLMSTLLALVMALSLFVVVASAEGLTKADFDYYGSAKKDSYGFSNYINLKNYDSDEFVVERYDGTWIASKNYDGTFGTLYSWNKQDISLARPDGLKKVGIGSSRATVEKKFGKTQVIHVTSDDEAANLFDRDSRPIQKETYRFAVGGAYYYQTYYFNEVDQVCLIVWH